MDALILAICQETADVHHIEPMDSDQDLIETVSQCEEYFGYDNVLDGTDYPDVMDVIDQATANEYMSQYWLDTDDSLCFKM